MSAQPASSRLTGDDGLDGRQVADLLHMPLSTVLEYTRRGLLPARKLGRRWIFLREEIEAAVRGDARVPSGREFTGASDRPERTLGTADRRSAWARGVSDARRASEPSGGSSRSRGGDEQVALAEAARRAARDTFRSFADDRGSLYYQADGMSPQETWEVIREEVAAGATLAAIRGSRK